MEASTRKVSYPCYQTVFNQTFPLSEGQECVVSDTLPDITAIVYTSAAPLIRSKDLSDGRVRLEANVPARVTCLGEDGTIFCVDVNIPFYLSAQDEGIRENCVCVAGIMLRQTETRLLNPRKLSVRAELQVQVECCLSGALELAQATGEPVVGLHTLERGAEISTIAAVTEKTFVLTDEYTLTEQEPSAVEILAQSVMMRTQELKTVGSKLIVSGLAESALLYRGEDGDVYEAAFQTAFSQIIEADIELEDASVELKILPSGMYYEIIPGTEMRELAMELHLVAQAVICAKQSICYLADAYSNLYPLELQRETRGFTFVTRESVLRENGKALLETPETVSRVISCRATPLSADFDGGSAIVRFRVTLCCRSGEKLCTVERVCAQTFAPETTDGAVKICGFCISDLSAVPTEAGVEVRFSAELRVQFAQEITLECVSAIGWNEEDRLDTDDLPTLVLLRADSSQNLWQLAKENCSSVEAIAAANGLEEAGESWNKLLVIPKAL